MTSKKIINLSSPTGVELPEFGIKAKRPRKEGKTMVETLYDLTVCLILTISKPIELKLTASNLKSDQMLIGVKDETVRQNLETITLALKEKFSRQIPGHFTGFVLEQKDGAPLQMVTTVRGSENKFAIRLELNDGKIITRLSETEFKKLYDKQAFYGTVTIAIFGGYGFMSSDDSVEEEVTKLKAVITEIKTERFVERLDALEDFNDEVSLEVQAFLADDRRR